MQPKVAQNLIELNHKFYQTFADSFSATRQRIQPGVMQILNMIPPTANILDLGCGNGVLAAELINQGYLGQYLGLDFSAELVGIANQQNLPKALFRTADLTSAIWDTELPNAPFDMILCFAMLHHLPGESLRLEFLQKAEKLLIPEGRFVLSNWQFLNSPKLRSRIKPWETVGLKDGDVDPGDHLMDWRREGEGTRYVHQFSSGELHSLAAKSGFRVAGLFTSDGETGDLGLYMIWEKRGHGISSS
jgi:SAM-dependent methyltransferase